MSETIKCVWCGAVVEDVPYRLCNLCGKEPRTRRQMSAQMWIVVNGNGEAYPGTCCGEHDIAQRLARGCGGRVVPCTLNWNA